MSTTVIKNADWVIAWDPIAARHVYKRGVDVVFEDDKITHVGKDYAGAADKTLPGRNRMVMPGLVNIHSVSTLIAIEKGAVDKLPQTFALQGIMNL